MPGWQAGKNDAGRRYGRGRFTGAHLCRKPFRPEPATEEGAVGWERGWGIRHPGTDKCVRPRIGHGCRCRVLPVLPEQGEVTCRIELGSGRLPYHDAFRVDDIDAGDTGTGEAVEDRTVAVEIPRHPKVMVFPVPGEDIGTLFVPSFRAAARYGYDGIAGLPSAIRRRLRAAPPGSRDTRWRRKAAASSGRRILRESRKSAPLLPKR